MLGGCPASGTKNETGFIAEVGFAEMMMGRKDIVASAATMSPPVSQWQQDDWLVKTVFLGSLRVAPKAGMR